MGDGGTADKPTDARMDEAQLLGLIRQYEQASLGSQVAAGATISTTVYPSNQAMTTLQVDRYNALNAYMARPLGNEVENRSQVVLPVVRDTVAWIMPQLMRMFAGSKSICRFEPDSEADEAQAEMETEVVNHIFMTNNNGLLILHDFFWDALLLRNGYAQVYTRQWRSVKEERYTGLSQIELTQLLQDTADEELQVLEQREYLRDLRLPVPQDAPPVLPPGAGLDAVRSQQGQLVAQIPAWDLHIRRTKDNKRVMVACLPPEEMRVTPRAREGLDEVAFAMHMTTKTRSDLIADGFEAAEVNSLAAGRPQWLDIDALARDKLVDQLSLEHPSDFSMQEIEVRTVVMRVDYDGDGVAELREILVAGDKILRNELIEETRFVSCEALRMPHRHTGLSIYDLVMDLQVIQTNLLRAGLDNLTIANNLRIAVDWRNVNMDDLLSSRPHGPIRGNGPPGQWIQPLQMPTNVMSEVVPMLGYMDQLRANRTGVGKGTMGLDADELQNVTKGGQLAALSAAALIVELIARMLAEGCKGIFQKIHGELLRNQDKPLQFKIRGKWTEVDPASWRERTAVTPNVGLGSGNREELRANVQLLAAAQMQIAQMGLVGPQQAFEAFKVMCEALGFNNPERFAMDPASQQYQQHVAQMAQHQQTAPAVQVAQIRAQTEAAKQQATNQREVAKLQGQLQQEQISAAQQQLKDREQIVHEALQNEADRQLQAGANQNDVVLQLLKILGPIVASQLKGDEGANAGQVLAQDERALEPSLHERIASGLEGLTQAVAGLHNPRTATLADGSQIRID